MGVSIMYKPVKNDGKAVGFGHRSTAMKAIEKLFGSPAKISAADSDKLYAMAEATGEQGYQDLADAAILHGEIEVWGEQ